MARPLLARLQHRPSREWYAPNVPAAVKPQLAGASLTTRAPKVATAVLLFARDEEELWRRFRALQPRLVGDPLLWVCYPKGTSGVPTDLSREVVWQGLWKEGFRPVQQISVDETWTAMRFRASAFVKSRPGAGPDPKHHPVSHKVSRARR